MEDGVQSLMTATRQCEDFDKELDSLLKQGYRLDMIMPADEPREALLSKDGEYLRVCSNAEHTEKSSAVSALKSSSEWITGRAGMEYRDLIPDRLGGRVIASHIRIKDGGEVPDYIHYHKIRFQLIYCKAGTIRVVYEDQGPPFELNAGDCVLQPPEIRHRVLESTAGAEVIELSSPAEHETWVEHEMSLPTVEVHPDREFDGQKFVRSVAITTPWHTHASVAYRDTGIGDACAGFADVRLAKFHVGGPPTKFGHSSDLFMFVLSGEIEVSDVGKASRLAEGESILLPAGHPSRINALSDAEVLEVALHGI